MMDSIKFFLKTLIPYALIAAQFLNLLVNGAIFEKQPVEDGTSATLAVYEKDVFRARLLAGGYYDSYWHEGLSILTNKPHNDIESCWGYCGLLSLSYKMAILDKKNIGRCEKVVEGLRYFRRETADGKFNGYGVWRNNLKDKSTAGVSYDDDMWLARDLIGLYELTGKIKYLDLAKEIADFIIEYAFVDLDPQMFRDYGFTVDEATPLGGFYWNEDHQALHACSNGPAVQLLAALYRLTGNQTYLQHAVKSYNFLQYLVKPEGVLFDLMVFEKDSENNITGIIHPDGPPYSYNSGSPITGAVELYRATGETKYLDTAKYWAKSADAFFAKDSSVAGVKSYPVGNVWFNLILLNGYTALAPYDAQNSAIYIGHMQSSIDYAYDHYLSAGDGRLYGRFLPGDWVNGWGDKNPKEMWVLDASSQAEIYATMAVYEKAISG